uniref:Uncharacterized protein n=1 Tax=Oryza glumipatula TaxID=40148 RepID=A0A0D9YU82_9ORYZ
MVAHLSSTSLRWQRSRLRQVLILPPPLAMASGSTVRFVSNSDGGGTNATFGSGGEQQLYPLPLMNSVSGDGQWPWPLMGADGPGLW